MAGKTRRDSDNGKNPDMTNIASLTIRDVVLIMAAVVSVVAAWGVYGTRLSLVERSNVTLTQELNETKEHLGQEITELKQEMKDLSKQVNKIDNEQARRKSIVDKVEKSQLKE